MSWPQLRQTSKPHYQFPHPPTALLLPLRMPLLLHASLLLASIVLQGSMALTGAVVTIAQAGAFPALEPAAVSHGPLAQLGTAKARHQLLPVTVAAQRVQVDSTTRTMGMRPRRALAGAAAPEGSG